MIATGQTSSRGEKDRMGKMSVRRRVGIGITALALGVAIATPAALGHRASAKANGPGDVTAGAQVYVHYFCADCHTMRAAGYDVSHGNLGSESRQAARPVRRDQGHRGERPAGGSAAVSDADGRVQERPHCAADRGRLGVRLCRYPRVDQGSDHHDQRVTAGRRRDPISAGRQAGGSNCRTFPSAGGNVRLPALVFRGDGRDPARRKERADKGRQDGVRMARRARPRAVPRAAREGHGGAVLGRVRPRLRARHLPLRRLRSRALRLRGEVRLGLRLAGVLGAGEAARRSTRRRTRATGWCAPR